MVSTIIETIVSALAEQFAGKAVEKGLGKAQPRVRGWVTLCLLVLLLAFLVWFGIYLLPEAAFVGILMLAIAACILAITVASVIKTRSLRKAPAAARPANTKPKGEQP